MNQMLASPPPSLDAPQLKPNEANEVFIAPYWIGKGSPFPESTIPYLFARTKEDGLLRRIFPQEQEITLPQFIERMSRYPLLLGFEKSTNEVMAYSFLAEYSGPAPWRKANIGFCVFKKFWGRPEIKDMGRLILDWFFHKEGCAVLYGTIRPFNRIAVQFARELYFDQIGRLPMFFYTEQGLEDAILVALTRDEFVHNLGSRYGVGA
jgi:RimJ/RimL family protein N-acetyltransferase